MIPVRLLPDGVDSVDHLNTMVLVGYSDSEGSDDESPPSKAATSTTTKPPPPTTTSNPTFSVNKANPRKIQVRLQDISETNGHSEDEPAPKRPRIGASAFSGFNSFLPPPKRDADAKIPSKPSTRKVFSLKTGAEPGFSRESDAELRNAFAERDANAENTTNGGHDDTIPSAPKTNQPSTIDPVIKGNPFMFKPLSVARGNKKKKSAYASSIPVKDSNSFNTLPAQPPSAADAPEDAHPAPAPKKVSLFSINHNLDSGPDPVSEDLDEDAALDTAVDEFAPDDQVHATTTQNTTTNGPQSLDSIASDLNLSEADRRQLFGRRGQPTGSAINVVNFNTDQEYAANEVLRASGEQIQHNPVRGIAPGKHSLKQLVNAAVGQKEALEESFATGRRNKKEAGSKYGW